MSIEVVAVVALVGVIAYFVFGRRKSSASPAPIAAPSEPTPRAPELTPEERDIANAREALRAGADARTAAYNEHKASLADAQAKLREAEKFARDSGLDVAVPWAWEHMQFWPSWKEKADQWTPPIALDELSGTSGDEVRWTWQGQSFAMLFKKWPSHGFTQDALDFGTITVEADGEVVAALTAKMDLSKEYDRWHFSGIDALKVGPWIAEFIRFYQEVRLADEARGYARDAEYVTAKAARIDLG